MQLKINVYNELDEVVKEYTRDSYSIRMRQLKNIIETLEIERLANAVAGNNIDIVKVVGNIVVNGYDKVKELILDVFPKMTEEEFEETHLDEVIRVVIDIAKYSVNVISIAGGKGKN